MKVGVDGRLIDITHDTGISRYTEFILNYYINKYTAKNIYLIVNDNISDYKGVNIIHTNLKPYNLLHIIKFKRFIQQFNFNILHIPFYSGCFNNLPQTKVITTVHDLMYRIVDNFFGDKRLINLLKRSYFNFIIRNTLKHSDIIISVSKTTQNDLLRYFGIKSTHIPEYSVLSNKQDTSILAKYGLEPKKFFFYCGNNRPHKNLQRIEDVFNREKLPPLVLAGNGHKEAKNIINLGTITEEELVSLYQNCIAFIFPSYYEGFGLPVLEALYNKCIVIASNISAFKEFHSKNIIYFNPTDSYGFKNALKIAQKRTFIEEPDFWDMYLPCNIYKMLDNITDKL